MASYNDYDATKLLSHLPPCDELPRELRHVHYILEMLQSIEQQTDAETRDSLMGQCFMHLFELTRKYRPEPGRHPGAKTSMRDLWRGHPGYAALFAPRPDDHDMIQMGPTTPDSTLSPRLSQSSQVMPSQSDTAPEEHNSQPPNHSLQTFSSQGGTVPEKQISQPLNQSPGTLAPQSCTALKIHSSQPRRCSARLAKSNKLGPLHDADTYRISKPKPKGKATKKRNKPTDPQRPGRRSVTK